MTRQAIDDCVRASVQRYFEDLNGAAPSELHRLFLDAAERPLLEVVMREAEGNQSRAAAWLGINRNTLRRKLLAHQIVG